MLLFYVWHSQLKLAQSLSLFGLNGTPLPHLSPLTEDKLLPEFPLEEKTASASQTS